jgi:predicted metal-dependent hydrolase
VRDGQVFVRLAEMAMDAPIYVQQALAQILVAKLLRRKVPKKADDIYREFSKHPLITERANHTKRTRGRKTMTGPKGRFYDLDELFNRINREFFDNALPKPALSWSKKKTKSILGHHDPIHDAIVISKTLDSLKVPVYVVDFVMFHEMLHIKHPTRTVNGRQQKHSRAFKLEEKRFPDMQRAEDWLRSF